MTDPAILAAIEALRATLVASADQIADLAATTERALAQLSALEALVVDGEPDPGLPVVSIADAEPVQAGEALSFEVTLSTVAALDVSVNWTATTGGGTLVSDGTLLIEVGTDVNWIEIETVPEVYANYIVTLSNPVNATLGRATATGKVLPEDTGEPDLWRGLLYSLPATTSTPIDLAAGELTGVQTICMVAKVQDTTGQHKKFAGCASSQSAGQGAFGIGVNPQGKTDVWRAGGGLQNPFSPQYNFPARQAVMLFWQVSGDEMAFGFDGATTELATPLVASDGPAAIGAGYWAGARVNPIDPEDEIRACDCWDRVLTEAEITLWQEQHAHLEDQEPDPEEPGNGGGGGNGGENGSGNGGGGPDPEGLEPVDPSAHQVAITVDSKPRQEWQGFGYGCNDWSSAERVFHQVQENVRKLCEDLDSNIMRIFTPENPSGCLKAYRSYWNLFREHGVDTIFASCFLYRSTSASAADPTLIAQAQKIAQGIKACIDGGMNALRWFVSLQNEPEGNPANGVKGNYAAHHKAFLDEIARLGLAGRMHLVGLEWRHGPNRMAQEYDAYAGAGMLGDGKIAWGCHHIYDKGSDDAMFDQRWAKQRGIWSTELGNNSDSASSAGRMIAGMNHGSVAEIVHYCQVATPSPNSEQLGQALLDWSGKPRPIYGALQAISTTFARGDVFRLCTSNDRPPSLPVKNAERMIRNAATCGGRNPRQEVTVARRSNGRWVIAAVNTTHGSDGFNAYTSGHYGGLRQQLTVRLPEPVSGNLAVKRAALGGGMTSAAKVAVRDGVTRFTLQPGETLGATQE